MSYFEIEPMSEREIDELGLLEEGDYDFEVIKSERKTSQNGNPMALLQLKVFDKNGKVKIIKDNLMFIKNQFCMRKLRHFCESVEILDSYNSGKIPEILECLSGRAKFGIEKDVENDKGGFYPPKNIVLDYLKKDKSDSKLKHQKDEFNDDIPF